MSRTYLNVQRTGPLATIQDLGRPGMAGLGVGTSGAADTTSLRLANRLVGNPEGLAAVEITLGGLEITMTISSMVAITGAPCPATVNGHAVDPNTPVWLPANGTLRLQPPSHGLRSYLAVRGGIDVPPVLGSRSTDTLSGLGPEPLRPGMRLPIGPPEADFPAVDLAPVPAPAVAPILRVIAGPREDWFTSDALTLLCDQPYRVGSDSNRIGLRLHGKRPLSRRIPDELPPEAMVLGALQVPPSGQPILFLADHPVTGGYPVIAVVVEADLHHAAQVRPGQQLHFRLLS